MLYHHQEQNDVDGLHIVTYFVRVEAERASSRGRVKGAGW